MSNPGKEKREIYVEPLKIPIQVPLPVEQPAEPFELPESIELPELVPMKQKVLATMDV